MSSDQLLASARRLLQGREYDAALVQLRAILGQGLDPRATALMLDIGTRRKRVAVLEELLGFIGPEPATWDCNFHAAKASRTLGRSGEAERFYRQARERLDKAIGGDPRDWQSQKGLGVLLWEFGNPGYAVTAYTEALNYAPLDSRAEILNARGTALRSFGRPDRAEEDFRHAIALDPRQRNFHTNLANVLLLQKRYPEGWEEYEHRLPTPAPVRYTPDHLRGRVVWMLGEQGFGDQIQFLRYAALVDRVASGVVVTCPKELQPLFARESGGRDARAAGTFPPEACLGVALMSFPRLFSTDAASIPPPADFKIPQTLTDELASEASRLLPIDEKLKVGIVWAGSPFNANDHNRSCPLAALEPLLSLPRFRWFSLQQERREGDDAILRRYGVQDLSPFFGDSFLGTAAVIRRLDLVVAVDTSLAHLAGSLGVPLLVLLPFDPDWRWGLGADSTAWYPTARLCRQTVLKDWSAAVADAVRWIRAWESGRSS